MRHIIAAPVRGPAKFWQRILHPFGPVISSPVVGAVLFTFFLESTEIVLHCVSYPGVFLLG
jgi:hypothetical protein